MQHFALMPKENLRRKRKFRFIASTISLALYLCLILFLDQSTKYFVNTHLIYGKAYPIITGFLNLTLVYNRGGAFGLLSSSPQFFIVFSFVTFLMLIYICIRLQAVEKNIAFPFLLVFSGAIGNLIDRIRHGYVVDFIDFYVGSYHWPAFNIADSTITIGILMLIWKMWRNKRVSEKSEKGETLL